MTGPFYKRRFWMVLSVGTLFQVAASYKSLGEAPGDEFYFAD